MKRLILVLILVLVLTLTLATPAFAQGPPDEKPMPAKAIQGLAWACEGMSQNIQSYLKDNPSLFSWGSTKLWTNSQLLGYELGHGPPIAWGYWLKKP